MKVVGATSAPRAAAARPSGRAGESDFRVGSGDAAAAPAQTGAAAAAGALLALQDESGRRARNRAALERMLGALQALHDGLIDGEANAAALAGLANAASAKMDDADPQLAAIAEEIVCRARVELAKRGL